MLRLSNTVRILIICQRYTCLQHWQYHFDCFLENVRINVADNENESDDDCETNAITIASIDYVLNHLTTFTTKRMDCVIFQDQQLQTPVRSFVKLNAIHTNYKIILASNDLMVGVVAVFVRSFTHRWLSLSLFECSKIEIWSCFPICRMIWDTFMNCWNSVNKPAHWSVPKRVAVFWIWMNFNRNTVIKTTRPFRSEPRHFDNKFF